MDSRQETTSVDREGTLSPGNSALLCLWQVNIPSKIFRNEMTWVPLETLQTDHFNQDDACAWVEVET